MSGSSTARYGCWFRPPRSRLRAIPGSRSPPRGRPFPLRLDPRAPGISFAVVGLSAPTVGGFAFGLPLLFLSGATLSPQGDQLAGVLPGDLPAGDFAVAFDIWGGFSPSEWTFDLCVATGSGGLFYLRKAIYHGMPAGPAPSFEDVKRRSGSPLGPVISVSCSAGALGLHTCAVDGDGTIWHSIRDRAGSWAPFGNVNNETGASGTQFVQVGISAFNGPFGGDPILHVVGVDDTGDLLHTIRFADGTWAPFGSVKAEAGDPGPVTSADAGAIPWLIP